MKSLSDCDNLRDLYFLALLAISAGSHKFANSIRASGSNNRLAGESFWEKWLHPTALFSVKRIRGLCSHSQEGREQAQDPILHCNQLEGKLDSLAKTSSSFLR